MLTKYIIIFLSSVALNKTNILLSMYNMI